jgi:hypothetical protein
MIESDESASHGEVRLAMPSPQDGLYAAPQASEVTGDLSGVAGPPSDRYVRGTETEAEKSFFSRLFASLIE